MISRSLVNVLQLELVIEFIYCTIKLKILLKYEEKSFILREKYNDKLVENYKNEKIDCDKKTIKAIVTEQDSNVFKKSS